MTWVFSGMLFLLMTSQPLQQKTLSRVMKVSHLLKSSAHLKVRTPPCIYIFPYFLCVTHFKLGRHGGFESLQIASRRAVQVALPFCCLTRCVRLQSSWTIALKHSPSA